MFFMISATETKVGRRWEEKTISYSVTTPFGFIDIPATLIARLPLLLVEVGRSRPDPETPSFGPGNCF